MSRSHLYLGTLIRKPWEEDFDLDPRTPVGAPLLRKTVPAPACPLEADMAADMRGRTWGRRAPLPPVRVPS